MMRYFILTILLILSYYAFSQTDEATTSLHQNDRTLFVGEDLTYIVKYAFLNLGEVRFRVLEKANINNTSVYKTIAYIDSYPDLPFVSIHQIYESYIDSTIFPLKFIAKIFGDDTVLVKYDFIGNSEVKMQKEKRNGTELWFDSTAQTNHRMQDGLSILYFARMNFGKQQSLSVPCIVNEKEETVELKFYDDPEPVEIDSVEYQINCLYLDGYTDFVSVYGLTGYFEGWFSNDEFAVPIRAKMNVIIGSINLELIKWNEKLWTPPIYKN